MHSLGGTFIVQQFKCFKLFNSCDSDNNVSSLLKSLPANCQHTAPEVDMKGKITANHVVQRARNSLQSNPAHVKHIFTGSLT